MAAVPASKAGALRRGFGAMVRAVKEKSPSIIEGAQGYLSKATGQNVTDVVAFGNRGGNNAALATEALVRSGADVAMMFDVLPVLDQQELAAYRDSLYTLAVGQNARADAKASGLGSASFRDSVGNALRLQRVCRSIGVSPDELWELIVIMREAKESDLEALSVLRSTNSQFRG